MEVTVDTNGLKPSELEVRLMFRTTGGESPGPFSSLLLEADGDKPGHAVPYRAGFRPPLPGDYGYIVRITPRHERMSGPYELFVSAWG